MKPTLQFRFTWIPGASGQSIIHSSPQHQDSFSRWPLPCRGLSTSRTQRSRSRRRSPSRNPDSEPITRPAANSQSQSQSSCFSSQPAHEDLPQEDVLIDLIATTEASRTAVDGLLHGLKRPHDGESTAEPSPKRDKLGEELEQMMADARSEDPPGEATSTANGPSAIQAEGVPASLVAMRRVLPMRHTRRPSAQTVLRDGDQPGSSSSTQNSDNSGNSEPRTPRDPRSK